MLYHGNYKKSLPADSQMTIVLILDWSDGSVFNPFSYIIINSGLLYYSKLYHIFGFRKQWEQSSLINQFYCNIKPTSSSIETSSWIIFYVFWYEHCVLNHQCLNDHLWCHPSTKLYSCFLLDELHISVSTTTFDASFPIFDYWFCCMDYFKTNKDISLNWTICQLSFKV